MRGHVATRDASAMWPIFRGFWLCGQSELVTRSAPSATPRARSMRYEGTIYRPPSEAESYILQATIGCSWNKCVYCDMCREKEFRVRELAETLEDLRQA